MLGHVAGLTVAHDRAVAIFRDRQDALRSQYAMLALMVTLHRRGPLDPLAHMTVLAHGGLPGLIAELSIAWVVGGVLDGGLASGSGAGGPRGEAVLAGSDARLGATNPP